MKVKFQHQDQKVVLTKKKGNKIEQTAFVLAKNWGQTEIAKFVRAGGSLDYFELSEEDLAFLKSVQGRQAMLENATQKSHSTLDLRPKCKGKPEDLEKAELEARVAKLEKELAQSKKAPKQSAAKKNQPAKSVKKEDDVSKEESTQ